MLHPLRIIRAPIPARPNTRSKPFRPPHRYGNNQPAGHFPALETRPRCHGLQHIPQKQNSGHFSGTQLVGLTAGDSTWTDLSVEVNTPYEYRVQETGTNGQGFVLSSIALAPEHTRGRVILVVDSTFSNTLVTEITRLTDDLEGDGWDVVRIDVARTDSVSTVKTLITNAYNQSPETTKSLFLLGHVPVPYSGQIGPDGHGDHIGAWSCDGYYGDFNTGWTDQFVTAINSSNPRNHNVLGDGKFDQNNFPSNLELGVGRVDLSDLPAFALSETELMRRYLDKDHAWRHKLFTVPDRGCVEDNFTGFGEGFSQNGWRNFPPLVGADSIEAINWDDLKNKDYLWAYGCGGGWYQGAGGIVTTAQYAQDSMRAVFTMTFGSYFGDWDNSNNLLRAALGSGTILSNAWAGRPHWAFHPMGLGETLGYCARISMNNNGAYPTGYSALGVHMALLGDPTLRQQIVAPPQNPTSLEVNSHVQLQWTPPKDDWERLFCLPPGGWSKGVFPAEPGANHRDIYLGFLPQHRRGIRIPDTQRPAGNHTFRHFLEPEPGRPP